MMPETFILIPGRTSRQGCGISEGKFKPDYQEETHILQVSPQDMQRLGVGAGRSGAAPERDRTDRGGGQAVAAR